MNKEGEYIMQGIKIDFITNTIIITKEFAELASNPTSEEYVTLNLVKLENPKMKIATRSRKKSSKERNQNKGLTYKFMRRYISVMDEDNLMEFNKQQLYYESFGLDNTTVYLQVRNWFVENYPDYERILVAGKPKNNIVPLKKDETNYAA